MLWKITSNKNKNKNSKKIVKNSQWKLHHKVNIISIWKKNIKKNMKDKKKNLKKEFLKYIHIHVRINELTRGPDCICIMCTYVSIRVHSCLVLSLVTVQSRKLLEHKLYSTILYYIVQIDRMIWHNGLKQWTRSIITKKKKLYFHYCNFVDVFYWNIRI